MTAQARLIRLRVLVGIALPLSAATASLLLLLAGGSRYWLYIATEQTPMTWLQSTILVLCAAVCAAHAGQSWLMSGRLLPWAPLSAGFLALALDERFAIHERVRESALSDTGIGLPWGAPGDLLLPVYAVVGLLALPALLGAVGHDRTAWRLLVGAVALCAVVVGIDTVDPDAMSVSVERLEQTTEEVLELLAGTLILLSLLLSLVPHRPPDPIVPARTRSSARSAAETAPMPTGRAKASV